MYGFFIMTSNFFCILAVTNECPYSSFHGLSTSSLEAKQTTPILDIRRASFSKGENQNKRSRYSSHRAKSKSFHSKHHTNTSKSFTTVKNISQTELDDLSILPIFHKLLSERREAGGSEFSIASCPNITIKCDIVEYL